MKKRLLVPLVFLISLWAQASFAQVYFGSPAVGNVYGGINAGIGINLGMGMGSPIVPYGYNNYTPYATYPTTPAYTYPTAPFYSQQSMYGAGVNYGMNYGANTLPYNAYNNSIYPNNTYNNVYGNNINRTNNVVNLDGFLSQASQCTQNQLRVNLMNSSTNRSNQCKKSNIENLANKCISNIKSQMSISIPNNLVKNFKSQIATSLLANCEWGGMNQYNPGMPYTNYNSVPGVAGIR